LLYFNRHARVISGEEEAIYGWTAVNFVKGSLIKNSKGSGSVMGANYTYGVLEMGGASTQIGFFEPYGDIMANLFKLQLGAAKHWNVYTHSFLYFGINGAYDRLNARLYAASENTNGTDIYNPCLPGGSEYRFTSRVYMQPNGTLLPLSSQDNASIIEAEMYSAVMRNTNKRGDFDHCAEFVNRLLRKEANAWCDFAHDRDCSFAGIYQPPLPVNYEDFGEFIATSNFYDIWSFLQLRPRSSLLELKDGARRICSSSLKELTAYNDRLNSPVSDSDELTAMCFRATFAASFLIDGVGFPETYNVTALDVVKGQKVGWALGSMLYEINTLPWVFKTHYLHKLLSWDMLEVGSFEAADNVELVTGLLVVLVLVIGWVGSFKLFVSRRFSSNSVLAGGSESTAFTRSQTDYGARR
jgi:GDA1/CD39 (nucleoside phosphatase) family